MTSWLPSLTGLMRRSRSDGEVMTQRSISHQSKPPLTHQALSLDLDSVPELEGESEILSEDLISRLADQLPPRIIGTPWRLLFTTSSHGFSLSSLYRSVILLSIWLNVKSFLSGSSSQGPAAQLCSVSRTSRRTCSGPSSHVLSSSGIISTAPGRVSCSPAGRSSRCSSGRGRTLTLQGITTACLCLFT